MPCKKCGILLHESNMNVWFTDGIVLCIKCEHELKALKQVIGNIRHCYNIIGRSYRKKLANLIDSLYNQFDKKQVKQLKIEFISFVLAKALKKTNKELFGLKLNKLGFYDKNRDLFPDEYNKALNIFGKHFQEILEDIVQDIVNKIKEVQ